MTGESLNKDLFGFLTIFKSLAKRAKWDPSGSFIHNKLGCVQLGSHRLEAVVGDLGEAEDVQLQARESRSSG